MILSKTRMRLDQAWVFTIILQWVDIFLNEKTQMTQQMLIILQIGFQPIVYDNMYHFIIAVGLVILNFSKKYGM